MSSPGKAAAELQRLYRALRGEVPLSQAQLAADLQRIQRACGTNADALDALAALQDYAPLALGLKRGGDAQSIVRAVQSLMDVAAEMQVEL